MGLFSLTLKANKTIKNTKANPKTDKEISGEITETASPSAGIDSKKEATIREITSIPNEATVVNLGTPTCSAK